MKNVSKRYGTQLDTQTYELIERVRSYLTDHEHSRPTVYNAIRSLIGAPHLNCSCSKKRGRPDVNYSDQEYMDKLIVTIRGLLDNKDGINVISPTIITQLTEANLRIAGLEKAAQATPPVTEGDSDELGSGKELDEVRRTTTKLYTKVVNPLRRENEGLKERIKELEHRQPEIDAVIRKYQQQLTQPTEITPDISDVLTRIKNVDEELVLVREENRKLHQDNIELRAELKKLNPEGNINTYDQSLCKNCRLYDSCLTLKVNCRPYTDIIKINALWVTNMILNNPDLEELYCSSCAHECRELISNRAAHDHCGALRLLSKIMNKGGV